MNAPHNFTEIKIVELEPALLTRFEAAKYLACSTRLLDRLAELGEIPRVKFDRGTRYRRADLDTFIESRLRKRGE